MEMPKERIQPHARFRQGMDIRRSSGVLAIVEGSTNMTTDDFDEAMRVFHDTLPEETNVVFGWYFDDVFGGNVKVTVFASFFSGKRDENAEL